MTPEQLATVRDREAIAMLHAGHNLRQIIEGTGISEPHLRDLARRENTRLRLARLTFTCSQPTCGQPRKVGRARTGWVQVKAAATEGLWFCSWTCVIRHARRSQILTEAAA